MPLGFLFFIAQDSLVSLELSGRRPRCLTASAVSAAENITKSVQAQIGRTYPHTLIACSDRTSVGLLSGGIPFAAGLELGEHVLIDLIVRLHGDRAPGVFKGDCIIADAAVGGGAVVVPLGAAFLHGIQDVESLLEHAVVDVAGGSTQMDRLLAVILLVGTLGPESIGTEKLVPEIGEILIVAVIGIGAPVFILPALSGTLALGPSVGTARPASSLLACADKPAARA